MPRKASLEFTRFISPPYDTTGFFLSFFSLSRAHVRLIRLFRNTRLSVLKKKKVKSMEIGCDEVARLHQTQCVKAVMGDSEI